MAKFTNRQNFIISLLLEDQPVTLDGISKQMEVSERTIFREIAAINGVLETTGVKISVRNSELTLLGKKERIQSLKQSSASVSRKWFLTSEQRILFITAQLLLADDSYKSSFFSYQLNVVEGTISMYMDKIQTWLAEKNLSLSRKRRYGIEVEGSEWNKRNALVSLIYEYKPFEELLPFVYETKDDPVLRSFFNFLFGERILQIAKEILELSPDCREDDGAYLTSLLHIMISVKKTTSGCPITLPDDFVREMVAKDADNVEFCAKLRDFLAGIQIEIPESEAAYICIHLPGKYKFTDDPKTGETGVPFDRLAEELLYEIQKSIGINLKGDKQLISQISHYIKFLLYRMELGIQMQNSMLDQIREHYGSLFDIVGRSCKIVFSKYNLRLSKDEIGFVTMYVGSSLEKAELHNNRLSVLILCPNGVFASRILMNKVQSVIHDIGTIDALSLHDWADNKKSYDLILSTVDIRKKQDRPANNFLVVSPFLSDDDVVRINECVSKIRGRAGPVVRTSSAENAGAEDKTTDPGLVRQMADGLWLELIPADSCENIILNITAGLHRRTVVENPQEIGRLILQREKIGSVVIPGAHVSLLHIRSNLVQFPFVGVYRLDGSIQMKSIGFVQEPVDTFLVLLAREDEHPVVLEKMGSISIALIENTKFTGLLRKGSFDEIQSALRELLEIRRQNNGTTEKE